MSVIFFDGFSFYSDVAIDQRWTSIGGTPSISASGGRRTGVSSMILETGDWLEKEFNADGTVIVGVAHKRSAYPSDSAFIEFRSADAVVGCVRLQSDGSVDVCKGETEVLDSSTTGVVLINDWYYIEALYKPRTSMDGEFRVRVTDPSKNMLEVVTVTVTATSDSAVTIDSVRVAGGSTTVDIGDLYLCNGQGADRNTFLGDQRVDVKRPQADGFHREWVPETGTRPGYDRVDELRVLDEDVMLAEGVSARDTYDFTRIHAVTGDVNAVQVHTASFKNDAGIASVQHLVRLNDTDYYGEECAIGEVDAVCYQSTIFEDNPQTDTRWTQKDVNNAEYGARPQ